MYILRFTFIAAILFVFVLCSPVEAAKHIIVIYDESVSMVSLNIGGIKKIFMNSEDINRVNDYLTDILFKDPSQPLRNTNKDSYIKECDPAYAGKPLYESGDILTYATYTDIRHEKITRKQVQRGEFRRQLPAKFTGQVSYLIRAEVEVYDQLYRVEDDKTYWVFVTDGDVDNSGKSDPGIADVLKRDVAIEDEYDDPMIIGILVKNHVRIQVRQIKKRREIEKVFIANRTALTAPVKKIQLSKDTHGQFMSETLIIDTENDNKTKFKLNSVNVEIYDKNETPLQIANADNDVDVLKVTPVSLHGHSPPYEFQISLPANPEIAATGNALKLKVSYNYNGKEKSYLMPLTQYETVIKSIFVTDPEKPNQQENRLILRFSENAYHTTLVIQSESPNKNAFRIENIRCHIEYKDERKLCDVSVKTIPEKLDEPFQIVVSKVKNFDLYGNKLVLNIDYNYEGTTESETIKFDYDRSGDSSRFPIMILFILGCSVLTLLVFAAIHVFKKLFGREKIEYQIMLGEVEQEGMQPDDMHFFTLKDGETLSFGVGTTDGAYFNLGSPAVLRCKHGEFQIFKDYDDENGRIVMSGQTFTLTRDEGDVIHIYFGIEDDEQQSQLESDYIIDEDDDYLLGN